MLVTYCGTCGAANGEAAKFCRHCGGELHVQEVRPLATTVVRPQTTATSINPIAHSATPPSTSPTGTKSSASSAKQRPLSAAERFTQLEQEQEEVARQHKEALTGRLAPRLAKAAAAQASVPMTTAAKSLAVDGTLVVAEQTPANHPIVFPSVPAVAANSAPVTTFSAGEAGVKFTPSSDNAGTSSAPLHRLPVEERKQQALEQALTLEAEEQHSAFWLRLGVCVLGVLILALAIYAYRHLNFPTSLDTITYNLRSPGDQSKQLVQESEHDLEAGKMTDAAQKLERAIELTPDRIEPHQKLAETYESAGQPTDAIRVYHKLLKLSPDDLDARLKIAVIQRNLGNLAEARAQYQRIIALNQDSPQASLALAQIEELDNLLANNEQPHHQAKNRLNNKNRRPELILPNTTAGRADVPLVANSPRMIPLHNQIDWATARPLEVPASPTTIAASHKDRGRRFLNIREYGAALRELQAAQRLTPSDKDLYYLLGSTYQGLGEPLKAFDHYKRCDGGDYAQIAQNGARQVERAARKEYDRQQQLGQPTANAKTETTSSPSSAPSTGNKAGAGVSFPKSSVNSLRDQPEE